MPITSSIEGRAEMNREADWDAYKKAILVRAAGDERKLLELMCEGLAPELANVSDIQYARELVAAWCEILEEFGGDKD
jgi:hypothetical protein